MIILTFAHAVWVGPMWNKSGCAWIRQTCKVCGNQIAKFGGQNNFNICTCCMNRPYVKQEGMWLIDHVFYYYYYYHYYYYYYYYIIPTNCTFGCSRSFNGPLAQARCYADSRARSWQKSASVAGVRHQNVTCGGPRPSVCVNHLTSNLIGFQTLRIFMRLWIPFELAFSHHCSTQNSSHGSAATGHLPILVQELDEVAAQWVLLLSEFLLLSVHPFSLTENINIQLGQVQNSTRSSS